MWRQWTISHCIQPVRTISYSNVWTNTTSELQQKIYPGKHKRRLPKITKSPLAAAAISGVLSWCSGRLLGASRTDFCFGAWIRDNAWCTSSMSPRSIANSKALWVASSSLLFVQTGSLPIFADRKMPCKIDHPLVLGKCNEYYDRGRPLQQLKSVCI